MSFITAKQHLEKYNLENRIIEFNSSTATVSLAAMALVVTEGEIAKITILYNKRQSCFSNCCGR